MNTFLPYPDFDLSAMCLDRQRLGKQRIEAMQILNMLLGRSHGSWVRHPAVRMWHGFEAGLWMYGMAICREWRSRGYRDTVQTTLCTNYEELQVSHWKRPFWLGDDKFHASHRSNLLRKDPTWYGTLGWTEPPDLPYVWPVSKEVLHGQ